MSILFAAGLALALPWLAAGIIAHRWGPARGTLWASHHAYAVRTFWMGVVGVAGALAGSPMGLLEPLLALTWLYAALRVGRGFLFWDKQEWITDPGRFL